MFYTYTIHGSYPVYDYMLKKSFQTKATLNIVLKCLFLHCSLVSRNVEVNLVHIIKLACFTLKDQVWKGIWLKKKWMLEGDAVDGSEIRRAPVEVGSYPSIHRVLYISGGAGFLPS